jgi:hypothetical protein
MAEEKKSARPKNDVLVTWRMESFPISVSQNKAYTDRLVGILDRRVRRNPAVLSYYNRGRLVWLGSTQQGITPQVRSGILREARKHSFDRFSVYTLAKRRHANDIEALARRIAFPEQAATRNFTRARDLGDVVRRDVRQWATNETRRINRSLRPMERRLDQTSRRLDRQEERLRKSYSKRIERASDAARQKKLRTERDRRISVLSTQRRRLQPLRNQIAQRQAELRSFQNIKV